VNLLAERTSYFSGFLFGSQIAIRHARMYLPDIHDFKDLRLDARQKRLGNNFLRDELIGDQKARCGLFFPVREGIPDSLIP
jgi:hypothetical protein